MLSKFWDIPERVLFVYFTRRVIIGWSMRQQKHAFSRFQMNYLCVPNKQIIENLMFWHG